MTSSTRRPGRSALVEYFGEQQAVDVGDEAFLTIATPDAERCEVVSPNGGTTTLDVRRRDSDVAAVFVPAEKGRHRVTWRLAGGRPARSAFGVGTSPRSKRRKTR